MDSLVHDGSFDAHGQYQHLTVDPLVTSLQPSEHLPSFPSVGSPLTDAPLPTHPVQAFSDAINSAASLPVPADVSLSDPRQMDISPTEVHQTTVRHDAVSAPASITTFQPQLPRESFPPEMSFDIPRPSQSSPAATSVSSFASHTSSPAIPGLNTASYGTIPPASIASALDSMGLPGRSRSGSAASPSRFVGSGSDLTFPSSGTTTSNLGSGYRLPPSEYDVSPPTEEEAGPDLGAPHMMVVDDVLKTIMQTANQARVDCSVGQTAHAGVKVDQLKKAVALVSELIAATRLADGSSPPSDKSSPPVVSGTRASPPNLTGSGTGPPYVPLFPSGDTKSQDSTGAPDHESRKRCASSMTEGDRAIKAMKMEPPDDSSQPPLSSFPFSSGSAGIVNSHPDPFSSNPPSSPPSRPDSSGGLPLHLQLNVYQRPLPASVPINFPPSLNVAAANGRPPDYTPPTSATQPPVGHMASFGHPQEPWSEHSGPFAPSSLSGSRLNGDVEMKSVIIGGPPAFASPAAGFPSLPGATLTTPPATTVAPSLLQSASRTSRSNSLSNPPSGDPFAYGVLVSEATIDEMAEYRVGTSRPDTGFSRSHSPISSPDDDDESDTGSPNQSRYHMRHGSFGDANHTFSRQISRRSLVNRTSTDNFTALGANGSGSSSHSNEVPQEYRAEVDRIFFEFLNKICSNLEATDAKGEPIHQTLMAKKMQRLDESPDFRPFKFRIQAFTNAFLEELARQGYPEDKIPMKKIRNYLWNSPYISRFNEDGKKAKSKGNHIWNIEAKKTGDGSWTFRPFQRRLAGIPPGVAYVGLRWTWTPRIWDPQASRNNLQVTYTSPSLPPWLSWHEDQYLTGIPTPDAQSCDVTVEAQFNQDGKEEFLSQTVHITIAPVANVDPSFSSTTSRRPSLVGDAPRRLTSDTVPQTSPSRPPLVRQPTASTLPPPPPQPVPSQDAQVIQVLTSAAQRVAQEAQSQVVAAGAPSEPGHELQALAKQQHVLTVTAQAVDDNTVASQGCVAVQPSSVLAAAAQQVVLQAARQVAADRSAIAAAQISAGLPPPPVGASGQVTVNEVSVATQSAVAQAVELTGPLSSEVDVLMTASSLLQAQQQAQVQAQVQQAQTRPAPPPSVPAVSHRHHGSFSAIPIPSSLPHPPEGNLIAPMPASNMDLMYPQR